MESFRLEKYLSNGIKNIVKGILKASLQNPKASLFMMKHKKFSNEATRKRKEAEKNGQHIPPFLISSITDKCNLHCKGCYAWANNTCFHKFIKDGAKGLMTDNEWDNVFMQAENLGVEFILLAGGEPFLRKDVLVTAGKHEHILFPIFTNGTMIDDTYLKILDENRNLLPVLSIEGNQATTDGRRGKGVYNKLQETMYKLRKSGIIFGASVTVTKQNMKEVFSEEFVCKLKESRAKAVIYVEYVPMDLKSRELALKDNDRSIMMTYINQLRIKKKDMLFLAFPGDEKKSGGCLAAGRGFFHINAHGGVEPCPFSPYSDTNILETSLLDALHSQLFLKLQKGGNLTKEHIGGCVLFEQKEQVLKLIKELP